MNLTILFIRLILGAVIAVVLMRIFHPEAEPVWVALLGIALVGGAYLMDYVRRRG